MITIRYVDLLLTVLTLCAVVSTAVLLVGMLRARRTLDRLDSLLSRSDALVPELERLANRSEAAVVRLHEVSDAAGRIVGNVESMTSEGRELVLPLLHELRGHADLMQSTLRQASALVAGARAGLAALRKDVA